MEQVLQQFCLDGTPVSCEPFGNGHINRTFRVTCSSGRVYTLQRINRVAFRHPEELIENIDAVSRFIARKDIGLEMICLCPAKDGRKYAVDAQGEFWRAYDLSPAASVLKRRATATIFIRRRSPSASSSRRWPTSPLQRSMKRFRTSTTPKTGSTSCARRWRPTLAGASEWSGRSLHLFSPANRNSARSAGCCAAVRCRCG